MSARVSCWRCALAGVALGAIGGAAWAQNGALPVSDLLIGDRIILKSKAVGFKGDLPENQANEKGSDAPARTKPSRERQPCRGRTHPDQKPGARHHTIGPFLGHRLGQTGWGISIIGTLGLASIKLAQRDGDQIREQTVQGFSTAVGLMFDLQRSADPFRLGILWGRDRVGSNSAIAYPRECRRWMAMQLGWEFGR